MIKEILRTIAGIAFILWMCMADDTPWQLQAYWALGIIITLIITGDIRLNR